MRPPLDELEDMPRARIIDRADRPLAAALFGLCIAGILGAPLWAAFASSLAAYLVTRRWAI